MAETDAQRVIGMSWSELQASSLVAAEMVRWLYGALGLLKMSWSFFVLAIALTGYRRGEKRAWYIMWLVPITLVSSPLLTASFTGDVFQSLESIPVITVSLLGLLLPYRKFFPR